MNGKQYHFYLNPDKVTDAFVIEQLRTETNMSGLIKGLLYIYYKDIKPYQEISAPELKQKLEHVKKERTK